MSTTGCATRAAVPQVTANIDALVATKFLVGRTAANAVVASLTAKAPLADSAVEAAVGVSCSIEAGTIYAAAQARLPIAATLPAIARLTKGASDATVPAVGWIVREVDTDLSTQLLSTQAWRKWR
jgi:hypothetical protein